MLPRLRLVAGLVVLAACVALVLGDKEPHEDSKESAGASEEAGGLKGAAGGGAGPSGSMGPASSTGSAGGPSAMHGFVASLSVIVVSELGDKTFFIAAIMAMRHPRLVVFTGALLALVVMTILSALFGWVTIIIPRVYTYYVSTALFAIFGLRMLKEGLAMSPDEGQDELEEVQSDLKRKDDEMEKESALLAGDVEAGEAGARPSSAASASLFQRLTACLPKIFLQALTLTFLAEWGDRSQLATILLAAREDVMGVTLGAVLGHALCTGLAVLGGRMIAQKISVKTVTLVGGVVFLIFAVSALFFDPES